MTDPSTNAVDDNLLEFNRLDKAARKWGTWDQVVLVVVSLIALGATTAGVGFQNPLLAGWLAFAAGVINVLARAFKPHQNMVRTRSAATLLKYQRMLYRAHAEPYNDAATRDGILARVTADIVLAEERDWMDDIGGVARPEDGTPPKK